MTYLFSVVLLCLPVLMGYIAHKNGHSWFRAFLLTLLAPPVGVMVVLLARNTESGRTKTNWCAKVLVSLIPLVASTLYVVVGGMGTHGSEYWNVAPWYIVVSLPLCAVMWLLAEIVEYFNARSKKR